MKLKIIAIVIAVLVVSGFFAYKSVEKSNSVIVTNFNECVEVGNPIAESYPQQCFHRGERFVQYIGDELQKIDLIISDSPRPNAQIESPLSISGRARGYWFFEGSFPVILLDESGKVIAESFVSSKGEWMTEDFVSYEGELLFEKEDVSSKGTLILKKDNSSDLRELDDELRIPIVFK